MMIGFLKGKVLDIEVNTVTFEVGGVGYQLGVSLLTAGGLKVGTATELWVHTHVREGIFALYGFQSKEERECFRILIGISGIGPRSALSLLSLLTPEKFVSVVLREDVAALTAIPGVGKKTAERIIVELRDKLKALQGIAGADGDSAADLAQKAVDALVSLGFDRKTVVATVDEVRQAEDSGEDVRGWITAALKKLHKA